MKKANYYPLMTLLMFTAMACSLPFAMLNTAPTQDASTMQTEVAQKVLADLTSTAAAQPTEAQPTNTAAASKTPESSATSMAVTTSTPDAPAAMCDGALFVTDVTIDDGTNFAPGANFIKTWRLKNTGSCTWNSTYALAFSAGDPMDGMASVALPVSAVAPGTFVDVSVNLKAPPSGGHYVGYWGIKNGSGAWVPVQGASDGHSFYVDINVGGGGADVGPFAVTKVTFNVSREGTCASGKYIIIANVTVNKAGVVNYHWVRSDGATGPGTLGSLTFSSAGKKQATFDWTMSAPDQWVDLFIDDPNNQQFGRANLNCP